MDRQLRIFTERGEKIGRESARQTDKEKDRQTDKQKDRQTERHRRTHRQNSTTLCEVIQFRASLVIKANFGSGVNALPMGTVIFISDSSKYMDLSVLTFFSRLE